MAIVKVDLSKANRVEGSALTLHEVAALLYSWEQAADAALKIALSKDGECMYMPITTVAALTEGAVQSLAAVAASLAQKILDNGGDVCVEIDTDTASYFEFDVSYAKGEDSWQN